MRVSFFSLFFAPRFSDVLPNERHQIFLLKKQIVDTLVHRATIDRNRKIMVDIRLNLLAILDQDAKPTMLELAYIGKGETYTRTPDMYPAGQIYIQL